MFTFYYRFFSKRVSGYIHCPYVSVEIDECTAKFEINVNINNTGNTPISLREIYFTGGVNGEGYGFNSLVCIPINSEELINEKCIIDLNEYGDNILKAKEKIKCDINERQGYITFGEPPMPDITNGNWMFIITCLLVDYRGYYLELEIGRIGISEYGADMYFKRSNHGFIKKCMFKKDNLLDFSGFFEKFET